MPSIAAYIPCFNGAATLAEAIRSLMAQTFPLTEILVVDDGSTDTSVTVARQAGVQVLCQPSNQGRGAARALAMRQLDSDFVLCCDSGNQLAPDFCERAMGWFGQQSVAAVFGRLVQAAPRSAAERWRGRHLFKESQVSPDPRHQATFATYGAIVRREAVLAVGNFDTRLRHSEDRELGERLLAAGHDVICDPKLTAIAIAGNSLSEVLERYWRWHAGADEAIDWPGYGRSIAYALKVMARADLQAGDLAGAGISLLCPHYQFWRSWWRHLLRQQRL